MAKTEKILLVDDEKLNLRLLEAMLVPLGYEVMTASNGTEALETARLEKPDLILLDVMMPHMDGFEVTKRLKADDEMRIIPVIMVTALQAVEDKAKALEYGADDFLTKPVDRLELSARVRSLLKVKAFNEQSRNYQNALKQEVHIRTEQLKHAFDKIKHVSLETIYRLTRASEYRDENTGVHIQRMSRFCETVARNLGLNEKTVESILYAAPMHDIGKIGIPDRILLKQGRLDSQEWEVMKQHTVIGQKILEGSSGEFLKLGEVIALTHHEKWDGTGYPKGLKGKKIPLLGRIVAVADVFDALTSKRPYKEAWSVEYAFETIEKGKGTHFDPEVVDVFLRSEREIISIKETYKDSEESKLFLFVD